MKVKTIMLFGDGKRLYKENEVVECTEEWVNMINSIHDFPLVKVIEADNTDNGNVEDGNTEVKTTKTKSKAKNK